MTSYFLTQQKLISTVRDGAKVTKRCALPTTPHSQAERHETVSVQDETIMKETFTVLNPADAQHQIQALAAELLALITCEVSATNKPRSGTPTTRSSARESTSPAKRAQ